MIYNSCDATPAVLCGENIAELRRERDALIKLGIRRGFWITRFWSASDLLTPENKRRWMISSRNGYTNLASKVAIKRERLK